MKIKNLSLAFAFVALLASQSSFACRILPVGDSSLRINALHATLAGSEQLTAFRMNPAGEYQLEVFSVATNSVETRTFRLENTSAMCPVYRAIRIN